MILKFNSILGYNGEFRGFFIFLEVVAVVEINFRAGGRAAPVGRNVGFGAISAETTLISARNRN